MFQVFVSPESLIIPLLLKTYTLVLLKGLLSCATLGNSVLPPNVLPGTLSSWRTIAASP